MLTKQKINKINNYSFLKTSIFLILYLCLLVVGGQAQTAPEQTDIPAMHDYKGIQIGMTADEVHEKLGKPKIEDKDGLFYVFSDDESAQIVFDGDKKVDIISVTYTGDYKNPPSFEDVFGKDVKPDVKPSGAVYKRIGYSKAGYWVAYSRLAGDKPTVSITLNKF